MYLRYKKYWLRFNPNILRRTNSPPPPVTRQPWWQWSCARPPRPPWVIVDHLIHPPTKRIPLSMRYDVYMRWKAVLLPAAPQPHLQIMMMRAWTHRHAKMVAPPCPQFIPRLPTSLWPLPIIVDAALWGINIHRWKYHGTTASWPLHFHRW